MACLPLAALIVGLGAPARGAIIDRSLKPGESFTLKGFQLSQEPLLCETTQCPAPPLGGQLVDQIEMGISLFLPWTEVPMEHPVKSFFFRPGDWKLRLEAPNQPNAPLPIDLTEFNEQHLELGSGLIGDQPGEGVVLYFPWPPQVWASAQQITPYLFLGALPPPDPGPLICGKDPTPSQLGACGAPVCP